MKNSIFILTTLLNLLMTTVTGTQLYSIESTLTPQEALNRLLEGNKRYAADKSSCEDRDNYRRAEVVSKQNPFAVILGCSDSRVSPEIIFDQGVGDLFVVRVAGNVAGISEIESLEYAGAHLDSVVILVLGHENCAAVTAVIKNEAADFPEIAALIEPAVSSIRNSKENSIEKGIKDNVRLVVETLKKSPRLKPVLEKKKILVVGGYYHLGSGIVELIQ